MPDYLSTDPNEGEYLSTDPNDGEPSLVASHTSTPSPSEEERTWADTAVDALPILGGIAGGLVGAGAASVPLAALGGAGGEGFRRTIQTLRGKRPVDKSTAETVQGLAKEGAIQGAGQAVGLGVGKGLQMAGKGAMRMAMGAQKGLRAKFPTVDLEAVALREGIGPGQSAAAGAASKAANEALGDAAANATGRVSPRAVTSRLRPLYERAKQARMGDDAQQIVEAANDARKAFRGGMSKADALVAKQELATRGRAVLQGASDPRAASTGAKIAGAEARGITDALRADPEIAGALTRSQELMALSKAVQSADNHTPMLRFLLPAAGAGTGYASGGDGASAIKGAAGAYALTNPRVLSLLGRGANASGGALGQRIAQLLAALGLEDASREQ